MEIWKPVIGYEGIYEISNAGQVKSLSRTDKRGHKRNEKFLRPALNARGYLFVSFYDNVSKVIHRLVAESFLSNDFNKEEVNHKNGNKTDNRLENLEWVTHSENLKHACETGLKSIPKGEKTYNAKLTNKEADEIRSLYRTGNWTHKKLSLHFGVSKSVVQKILNNKTYKKEA